MTSSITKKCRQRQSDTLLRSTVVALAMMCSPSIQLSSHKLEAEAFTLSRPSPRFSLSSIRPTHRRFSAMNDNQIIEEEKIGSTNDLEEFTTEPLIVQAPMRFIGPYPTLALKFPNLATESQRSRNQTGISLDFVLDTAANINTLQGQVAKELKLELLEDSPALPGVSSSGPMAGGETYVLGNSELEQAKVLGLGDDAKANEPFEFMQNLTAAVLPAANPGSAGLLGLAFFYCFEGGVEFQWGSPPAMQQQQQTQGSNEPQLVDGMIVQSEVGDASAPSITFYGSEDDSRLQSSLSELTRVPIDPIPLTQLPSVQLRVNGVEMTALLDTGSPVTVLNQKAAEAAGIRTTRERLEASLEEKKNKGGFNPFASVVDKFKEAQATAEAASRGDILMIGGIDGKPTNLYQSTGETGTSISLVGSSGEDVSLGSTESNKVFVGDIPGLAALNGIGVDSPPAVVLGLDVLRQRPRMVFRPRENEVFL